MGRRSRNLHPHVNQTPGAGVQRRLQPRRPPFGQRLFRQVCTHLEHTGKSLSQAVHNDDYGVPLVVFQHVS